MDVVIRKARKGEKIRSDELSITGRVIEVVEYDQSFASAITSDRLFYNRVLEKELGAKFRENYFECFIKVLYSKKDSEYEKGEIVAIDWKDYQKCRVLNY